MLLLRRSLVLLSFVLLAACADEARPPVTPLTLDYTRLGKIVLAVNDVSVAQSGALSGAPIDKQSFADLKPQLADAAYRWGYDRLQAGGGQGRAQLVITKASITRTLMQPVGGFEALFRRDAGEKWVAQLGAELRVAGAANDFSGVASAYVTRSTTLPENASAGERENTYRRLLLAMIDDLNLRMEKSIREYLQTVVVTLPAGPAGAQ
jgi:hypothetical protein